MWLTEKRSTTGSARAPGDGLARAAMPGVDVEIFWDGMWVRRVGSDYFPDPEMFRAAGMPRLEALGGASAEASARCGGLLVPSVQAAGGRCHRGYRRGPRRGRVRLFARRRAGRARLGHRAASGFIRGAAPVVRAQPAGECDGAELCVHGPGRRIADRNAAGMGIQLRARRRAQPGELPGEERAIRRSGRGARHRPDRFPEDEHRRRRAVGAARLRRRARAARGLCALRRTTSAPPAAKATNSARSIS